MDAMRWKGRILLLGGTGSERRRARLGKDGKIGFRDPDPTGLKKMDIQYVGGERIRTPHGKKAVAIRRAENKRAKQARKVNR